MSTDSGTARTAHPTAPPLRRSRPEDEGVPPAVLSALLDRWESVGVEAHGLMVLRHGRVVAQASWRPYRADGIALVYSVSKTFTSCAVGFAEAEGLLRLDERLVDLFPEAADVAGPRAARLTLHDVLAMSTGHREDTLDWRESDPATFPRHFLAIEPEEEPGSWFVYHNGATLMAALAVQRRSGQRLLDYLRPRLLDPLGIGDAAWSARGGLDIGYSGLHVDLEAVARLGELLRLDGVWEGERLLPEGWVSRATALQTDTSQHPETSDWHQGYGYQLWRCRHDAFRADGAWGQFAVVVPGSDLVVAVTSCSTDTQALLDGIWEVLLPALAPEPLPHDDEASTALLDRLGRARLPAPASSAEPVGDGPWEFVHEPTQAHPALVLVRVRRDPAGDWVLDVEDGGTVTVACGDGTWSEAGGTPWAASGGWTAPGVFEARVAAVETPHVLGLRCADGVVAASWNGEPLVWSALATLHAPRT
ncbi:serine hydrolase domain-containing protein [Oryzobacter terrae]|uniref:serine hydrolase domain-containing protein n=1 Tax=Oryzobacter terrae TaxID=1620385 RepID=UPI00367195E5